MKQLLQISKRGTITLPPEYRRKMGLDRMDNPLMFVEEKQGKLVMEPAAALPVRDIPEDTLKGWIREDKAEGRKLRKKV